MSEPLLRVHKLNKRFGGVVATDQLDLQVQPNEIHALIGPNGAGKTSLVAQLAGQLASDSGQVYFSGEDITGLVAHQRARRGLVRSFQITRLFGSFSVIGNVALAVQAAGAAGGWRFAAQMSETALFERALEVLSRLMLADKRDWAVDALSHGEQRALEVGLALAGRPRLLLLDEPMAGMGPEESVTMGELIAGLRRDSSVLLIEHDVDAVFRLADRVSVLVNGRIIASGTPEQVRRDQLVIDAYLGEPVEPM